MIYLIGALVVIGLLATFFKKTLVHLLGLLLVEIVLLALFPGLLVKFAQAVAYVRHLFA